MSIDYDSRRDLMGSLEMTRHDANEGIDWYVQVRRALDYWPTTTE